ncbi:Kcnh7 [Symbiodinium natans]|uniref:Kcnh7 protein n=1 Tax=Symbiodinium natans TaxID=878477 RepID=A0A812UAF4_9DINO|nr:Kcnh7 [Symbiodinium natans]
MSKTVGTSEDSTTFSCASWIRARVSPSSAGTPDDVVKSPSSPSGMLTSTSSSSRFRSSGRASHTTTTASLLNGKDASEMEDDSDLEELDLMDHTGSRFVMKESNRFRKVWTGIVTAMLMYIGTWFLFQLTFIDLHKPEPLKVAEYLGINDTGWQVWSNFVDALFYVDCFIYFFCSFQDDRGREVDCLPRIMYRYATGSFVVNVLASLPDQAAGEMMKVISGSEGSTDTSAHQAARTMRLQRASRLFRLARIGRLAKLTAMKSSPLWKWLQTLRGVRIINVLVGLFFSVHLLACGWYMCASLHADVQSTWLARRYVDPDGTKNLLDESDPGLQWLHAMYFILTVFTTVGFGDIAAVTPGEILYVVLTFLIGAVVHSIIIGEVIAAVTRVDERGQFVNEQRGLMERFAAHTELGEETVMDLQNWVNTEAVRWMNQKYDKEAVRGLLTGRHMARHLMCMLPSKLFKGQFATNSFFTALPPRMDELPPRLPMLLALNSHRQNFQKQEVIYQRSDFSNHFFLVTSGVFAHIGVPSAEGGREQSNMTSTVGQWLVVASAAGNVTMYPYQLFSQGSYFGEYGVIQNQPRDTTARCEARGSCIVVPKSEVERAMCDFPEFSSFWMSTAGTRERQRLACRSRLTVGRSYKHLAAFVIQSAFRSFRRPQVKPMLRAVSSEDEPRPPSVPELSGTAIRRVSGFMQRSLTDQRADPGDFGDAKLEMSELMREVRMLRAEISAMRRGGDVSPPHLALAEPPLIGQVPTL